MASTLAKGEPGHLCIPPIVYPPVSGVHTAAAIAFIRGGFTVAPHVQRFAQALVDELGQQSFGTYAGHDPDPQHAIDIFCPVSDPAPARAIADFTLRNAERFGVWYTISRQHIWNIERADEGWRFMADRGSYTANHYDHNHVSFYDSAPEEEDELTVGQYEELNARLDGFNSKLDTLLSKAQFSNDVLTEVKREATEAFGKDNWHQTGEAANSFIVMVVGSLLEIKKDIEELKGG